MNEKNSIVKTPCKVCNTPTRALIDKTIKKDQKVIYHVCDTCELIQKDPSFFVDHEEESTLYKHHNNSLENPGYVAMFERFIAEAINPFIKQGSGLEFGSGPGPVLYTLLERLGFNMRHFDPYFNNDQSVFNETYDLITSTEVFEHIYDIKDTLKSLVDILNPNGKLAIMTSFHQNDDDLFLNWWYRRDPTHISFYTVKTFKVLCETLPVDIIYTNDKNIIVLKKRS